MNVENSVTWSHGKDELQNIYITTSYYKEEGKRAFSQKHELYDFILYFAHPVIERGEQQTCTVENFAYYLWVKQDCAETIYI